MNIIAYRARQRMIVDTAPRLMEEFERLLLGVACLWVPNCAESGHQSPYLA
jgi:hypothetical protein